MSLQRTNSYRMRLICTLISATAAITAAVIKAHHQEPESPPSWYQSDDPCDYRIGDQYGHLTLCDLNSPRPDGPGL
jgi:hypothetical protein